MKTFLAAAVSFFVILGALFLYVFVMENITEELKIALERVAWCINEEEWEKAQSELNDFYGVWNNKRKILDILTDQGKTEDINENLAELSAYIENGDNTQARAKANVINELIIQLSANEKPTLVNLLKIGVADLKKGHII